MPRPYFLPKAGPRKTLEPPSPLRGGGSSAFLAPLFHPPVSRNGRGPVEAANICPARAEVRLRATRVGETTTTPEGRSRVRAGSRTPRPPPTRAWRGDFQRAEQFVDRAVPGRPAARWGPRRLLENTGPRPRRRAGNRGRIPGSAPTPFRAPLMCCPGPNPGPRGSSLASLRESKHMHRIRLALLGRDRRVRVLPGFSRSRRSRKSRPAR